MTRLYRFTFFYNVCGIRTSYVEYARVSLDESISEVINSIKEKIDLNINFTDITYIKVDL